MRRDGEGDGNMEGCDPFIFSPQQSDSCIQAVLQKTGLSVTQPSQRTKQLQAPIISFIFFTNGNISDNELINISPG